MQPIRGEMRAMRTPVNGLPQSSKPSPSTAVSAQIAVHEFHNSIGHALIQNCNLQSTFSKFKPSPAATDDSLDEMISSIPSFPEIIQCHWDLTDGTQVSGDESLLFEGPYDESPLLAAWFRQQQIISEGSLVGIQTMLPISAQLPEGAWIPQHSFGGSPPQAAPFYSTSAGANSGAARVVAPRKRVRARRGQATDPHSIAERRLRRDRIAEGMKALQELVPNANKTNKASDKASMLDEIINYVKFLQMQLKVFRSASPLIADIPSQGRGSPAAASETIAGMENLVAKLMEEDMGSAMQYLQGKGFCLMPISLVSTLSTATSSSAARRVVPGISTRGDALP